jgi:hypothetical protein
MTFEQTPQDTATMPKKSGISLRPFATSTSIAQLHTQENGSAIQVQMEESERATLRATLESRPGFWPGRSDQGVKEENGVNVLEFTSRKVTCRHDRRAHDPVAWAVVSKSLIPKGARTFVWKVSNSPSGSTSSPGGWSKSSSGRTSLRLGAPPRSRCLDGRSTN